MTFIPLSKLIPRTAARMGISRQMDAAHVCEKFRILAPTIVHKDILTYSYPKSYIKKTLIIGVTNGAFAQVIMAKKDDLIKSINKALGKPAVATIRTALVEGIKAIDAAQGLP